MCLRVDSQSSPPPLTPPTLPPPPAPPPPLPPHPPLGSFLLQSKVKYENSYQIQEDTLIVWAEPDGSNLALSFQEKLGCVEIWETLTDVSPLCVRAQVCVCVCVCMCVCVVCVCGVCV